MFAIEFDFEFAADHEAGSRIKSGAPRRRAGRKLDCKGEKKNVCKNRLV